MKLIKKLSEHIEEEIADAKCYAKWALELKDENRNLADTLYSISLDEMKHMGLLHDAVVKVIDEYRKTEGEPPAAMQAVYDYLHQKHIEEAQEAKNYQTMYREG